MIKIKFFNVKKKKNFDNCKRSLFVLTYAGNFGYKLNKSGIVKKKKKNSPRYGCGYLLWLCTSSSSGYHRAIVSAQRACSSAGYLSRSCPVLGLMLTSSLAGHPPRLLMPSACLYCQAHSLCWTSPCEVVVSMVRYVSFSSMLGG